MVPDQCTIKRLRLANIEQDFLLGDRGRRTCRTAQTGILAAGALAIVGLLIIPAKRRRAKNDLHNKLEDLRQRLMESMGEEFDRELARSLQRLREAIAPYTRFVRAEQQKLTRIEADLDEISASLGQVRARIEEM